MEPISKERLEQYAAEETCPEHEGGVRCGVCDGIWAARELLAARTRIDDLTEKHAACEKALSQAVADAEQTLADWKKEREERAK